MTLNLNPSLPVTSAAVPKKAAAVKQPAGTYFIAGSLLSAGGSYSATDDASTAAAKLAKQKQDQKLVYVGRCVIWLCHHTFASRLL